MEKVDEDPNLEFKWLKKRGVGGKNKEVQFYESFEYDGVKYMLYDCVYMYKEGVQEPYIGKLTKIWERLDKTKKVKKVKVHWFFRPKEISKWLGETKTLENEIFFASGEGHGLANINPLESIAGPCNVVCISKDSRNPQPSDEELKAADFIFYRTFDVQSCTVLDKLDEEVGGLEIKYVFNREEVESISPFPESTSGRKEENSNNTISSEPLLLATKNVPDQLKDAEKRESKDNNIPNMLVRNKTPKGSDNLKDPPFKRYKLDDAKPPKEQSVELEVARGSERLTDMPSKKSTVENSIRLPDDGKSKHEDNLRINVNNVKSPGTSGMLSEMGKTGKADKVENKERKRSPTESDKLPGRPLKQIKVTDKKPPNGSQVELEGARISERSSELSSKKSAVVCKSKHEDKLPGDANNLKLSGTMEEKSNQKNGKISANATSDLEGKSLKKTRDNNSFKMLDNSKLGISNKGSNGKGLVANSELSKGKSNSGLAEDSIVSNKELKEEQPGESKRKLSVSKSFKVSNSSTDRDNKTAYQEFECGPKPNSEKSGWFRRLPWEERLKNAYDQGTAILLHNVDRNYTSGEVEDIIWHAVNENCEAKILQRTALSSPHYAQALILLKTKEAAQRVLIKLDEECLMLKSNGRPLVGTPCPPLSTKKNFNYFGHLNLDKARNQYNREDEAVSTSHFSQPNTIEYDMAMEWCLLQSRSTNCWKKFHKQQKRELEKLMTVLQK